MKKLDGFKKNSDVAITDEQRQTIQDSNLEPEMGVIRRQSASQRGRERPISGRYENDPAHAGHLTNKDNGTLSQFNEDEDFRLSTDHQVSIAQLGGLHSQKSSVQNLGSKRGLNTATATDEDEVPLIGRLNAPSQGNQRSYQSTQQLGEGLRSYAQTNMSPAPLVMGEQAISQHKDSTQMKVDELSDLRRSSRQKIQDSVAY